MGYKGPSWAGTAPPVDLEKGWKAAGSAADKAAAATDKAAGAANKARDATGRFASTGKGAESAMSGLGGAAAEMFGGAGDSLASFIGKAQDAGGALNLVTNALKSLGPEGEAAALVIQAVATALTTLVVTLYDFAAAAVAAAQRRDALVATFNALGGNAEATLAATSKLAASLPYTTGQVNAWAKSLMAAGVQGKAMEQGVRAIASATAIMGQEGGAAAEMLIKRFAMAAETGAKLKLDRRMMNSLAQAGVSATALAQALGVPAEKLSTMQVDAAKLGDAMQKALVGKGGAALENVGLTWDSIKAKFDEGIGSIFAGMADAVRPFMRAVKDLFGEFNKGAPSVTVAGGVMRSVLTTLFSAATKVVNALHYGFLVVEVNLLKIAIFIAPVVNWLRKVYSNALVLSGLKVVLVALAAPFILIAAAVIGIVLALGALATAIGVVVSLVVSGIAAMIGQIIASFEEGTATISEWAQQADVMATNFVNGLVNGIRDGIASVVGAVTDLASAASKAFTSALGIKSPSRVMMRFGGYVAEGAAMGIEAGQGRVAAAATGLGAATMGGASAGAQGGGKGSLTVTVAPGAIVIQGAGKTSAEMAEEMFAAFMERLAMSQGLGVA